MPNLWRKVVKHPEGGAVKIDKTLWPSEYLAPWIGKQVWVAYDDLNVELRVFEQEGSAYITGPISYDRTDAGKASAEAERQRQSKLDPEGWDDEH